jgi:putative resolvase
MTDERQITWLTPQEASRRLGVSVRTLTRWEAEGRISPRRTPTGHRRYDQAEIDALLKVAS